jgi:aerobic carbon-monoxide dehydrogenase large subunit
MAQAIGARNVGASVMRVEDPRILSGRGHYIDDVVLPGMLHATFLRSPYPHARVRRIDATAARASPGVVAVYTGDEIQTMSQPIVAGSAIGMHMMPGLKSPTFHALATDKVRFVGDPLAIVIADSRALAEDACELIEVDYDPLPPVVTWQQALEGSRPPVFDELGDNVIAESSAVFGDIDAAFADADRVVTATLAVHRHQPVPMEGRGAVADYDPAAETFTYHASTQSPHLLRMLLGPQLGVPLESVRVLARDVGGGFGLKTVFAREDVSLAVASKALGRPVKWIEDRNEHLSSSGHAREETIDVEAAVTNEGVLLGLRVRLVLDHGAYPANPFPASMYAGAIVGMMPGPTRLLALAYDAKTVTTNKATYVAYRGPWATETFVRERLLDVVSRELGLDPVAVRLANYIRKGEPAQMITGSSLAGVTARESVERAVEILDYEGFRRRQREAAAQGRYLGLGLATYIEAAPGPRTEDNAAAGIMGVEQTHISLNDDGHLEVITRQQPHGQGHETTLAQVAADEMGVPFEHVQVLYGDTDITPFALVGTGGSRSATMAGGAVLHGARALKKKVLALAADLLEANPDDLDIVDGVVTVAGTPTRGLPLAEVVRVAAEEPQRLPPDADRDLRVTQDFDGGEGGWSGGTHCCVVEVDVETGGVEIERYVVIEDCGAVINPAIVDGQIRGGVAQGIGAVLLERSAYDEDGQYVSATFMDYLLPTAMEIPPIEIHHVDTVPLDPDVNFRGVGEGGMIVAPATVCSAIEDALAPFGVKVREQHLPPSRLLELLGVIG